MNKPPMHNYPGQQQQPQQQQQSGMQQQPGQQQQQGQGGYSTMQQQQHHQGNHYAPLNVPGAQHYGGQGQGGQGGQQGGGMYSASAKNIFPNAMLQQSAYPMQPGVMYAPAASVATMTERGQQQQARVQQQQQHHQSQQQQQAPPVSQSLPATANQQQHVIGRVGGTVSIMGVNAGSGNQQGQRVLTGQLQQDKPQSNGTTDNNKAPQQILTNSSITQQQQARHNVPQQPTSTSIGNNASAAASAGIVNSASDRVSEPEQIQQNNSVASVKESTAMRVPHTEKEKGDADTIKSNADAVTANKTVETSGVAGTSVSTPNSTTTTTTTTHPIPPPTPTHTAKIPQNAISPAKSTQLASVNTSPTTTASVTKTTTVTATPTSSGNAVTSVKAQSKSTTAATADSTTPSSGIRVVDKSQLMKTPEKKDNSAGAEDSSPGTKLDATGDKDTKKQSELITTSTTAQTSATQVATTSPTSTSVQIVPKPTTTMKLATTPRPRKLPQTIVATPKANSITTDSAKAQTPVDPLQLATSSKRQRTRTTPYQSPIPELEIITKMTRKGGGRSARAIRSDDGGNEAGKVGKGEGKETPGGTRKADGEKLIIFYRNEFLAVRNLEGSFYICQAGQNIYKKSAKITIRWLSQDKDEKSGEIYTPDFYDHTDFDCILTNLNLERQDKGKYRLPPSERERTDNILTRAIAVEKGHATHMDDSLTEEHPDGLDVSLYKDEEQLMKRKRNPKRKHSPKRKRAKSKQAPSLSFSRTIAVTAAKKSRKAAKMHKAAAPLVTSAKPIVSKAKIAKKMAVLTVAVPSTSTSKKAKEVAAKLAKANAGRTERAKRRQESSPVSSPKSSPVLDHKKVRVLAKVVKRTAIIATASKLSKSLKGSEKSSKSTKKLSNSRSSSGTLATAIPSTSTGVTRVSKRSRK